MSKSFMAGLLCVAARNVGAELVMGPNPGASGQFIFPEDGRRASFFNCCFDVNPYGSSLVARNKGLTRLILEREGIRFPRGRFFGRGVSEFENLNGGDLDREIVACAQSLTFPVVLKGADVHRGSCVYRIDSIEELVALLPEVWSITDGAIIEEYLPLSDFRLLVFRGEIVAAYGRKPLQIVGDGFTTASELIARARREQAHLGMPFETMTQRIFRNLKRVGYDADSVIPLDERVALLEVSNVSMGGTAWECSRDVNDGFRDYVGRIMSAMNLKFAGIDVLSQDISRPPEEAYFLEINSSPGFEGYARIGATERRVVERLAEDLILEMRGR